jgi:hypothetical protein
LSFARFAYVILAARVLHRLPCACIGCLLEYLLCTSLVACGLKSLGVVARQTAGLTRIRSTSVQLLFVPPNSLNIAQSNQYGCVFEAAASDCHVRNEALRITG